MSVDFVFILSLVVLGAALIYTKVIAAQPDVDEYFLYHQSSIGNIRKPGETAVYRSLVAGHGRSLMTGLSIAKQYGTRNGNLHDVWVLSEKSQISVASVDKYENYQLEKLPRQHFSNLVHSLGQQFCTWTGLDFMKIQKVSNKHVAVLLPPGLESLVSFFACNLYGLTTVFVPIADLDEEKLQSHVLAADPEIIVGPGNALSKLDYAKLGSVKAILTVTESLTADVSRSSLLKVSTWSEIAKNANRVKLPNTNGPELDFDDEDYVPVKFVYEESANHTSSSQRAIPRVASFSTQSIVAAIASQIKVLPVTKPLSGNDKFMVFTPQITSTMLVRLLSAFVVGASVIFPESIYAVDSPTNLMKAAEPTVLIMDDRTSYSLYYSTENLNLLGWIKLRVALSHLSHGCSPTKAVDPAFQSLRIVYTDHSTIGESEYITTAQANTIRALTAARVVHSLSTPLECGPVAQTSFYDYRNEDDPSYENFGPILPCFEAILKDSGDFKSERRQGELWVRGPATSSGVEWENTKVLGKFAHDGCFKIHNAHIAEAYD